MSVADTVLAVNNDLPIRTQLPVHSGKVRSVYWLTPDDSKRLIKEKGYDVSNQSSLAIMVISDRLSAFDCIWRAEGGLAGVPGKGAALNAISGHWFKLFKAGGLAGSHILDVPHPLVWIVQKARPVMIEAICRQYIAGAMWRAYSRGERTFSGINLPEGLEKHQRLPQLLVTPTTKGVLRGVPSVPETDDASITREHIVNNYQAFNFRSTEDIALYEKLLKEGFSLISDALSAVDQILVDTKFEFGYVTDESGDEKLIYMDEVGTPDSSRIWDGAAYREGKVVENSKEGFRQFLLEYFPEPDILLDGARMQERLALAKNTALPVSALMDISRIYVGMAEKITGTRLQLPSNPKAEIVEILRDNYRLID